jgi:selenocysteine-specific elongation factor
MQPAIRTRSSTEVFVVATAGHVDHGKSTLVRALTGMEPDRWAEERRRGLTIDLGFAWTMLPSGRAVAFVDVPGHERFLGNMLAGLGPAPVVCFVVAADEGWRAQSSDHRDAVAALGIEHGLLVISRVDRATDRGVAALAQAREQLASTGLSDAPAVTVSAVDGTGLPTLLTALDDVLGRLRPPMTDARVRLWLDRAFSITGAGTVVTGTLAAGTVRVGDRLELLGAGPATPVTVRGLQSRGEPHRALGPVNRVAVNLRGVPVVRVTRGDALVTPDAWPVTAVIDVRRATGTEFTEVPEQLTAHVGTAAVPARLRVFDENHARLVLARGLPLVVGDRMVLRHPGSRRILGGAQILDADPPSLRRRGGGTRRRTVLSAMHPAGDVLVEVARRGAVREQHLRQLGLLDGPIEITSADVRVIDGWWVHEPVFRSWQQRLRSALEDAHQRDPLAAGLSRGAAVDLMSLPDPVVLDQVVHAAGLESGGGYLWLPGGRADLGPIEESITKLESRLRATPFRAPEADELTALQLSVRELAAAERAGRILRLGDGVVLLPTAPALAMRELSRLPQPFTTSQARRALDTTRRVAIPLLESLDARSWTTRVDGDHRRVNASGRVNPNDRSR